MSVVRWLVAPRVAGSVAAAIVALAVVAAVGGTAAGARTAAEQPPPIETVADEPTARAEAPAKAAPLQTVRGRVIAIRGSLLVVRQPNGAAQRVRVLPRTVVRRGGERVELAALERGDRVVIAGRINDKGVLQARGIIARPLPAPAPGVPSEPSAGPGRLADTPPASATSVAPAPTSPAPGAPPATSERAG